MKKKPTNHANFMLIFTENMFFLLLLLIMKKFNEKSPKIAQTIPPNSLINQPKTILIIGF